MRKCYFYVQTSDAQLTYYACKKSIVIETKDHPGASAVYDLPGDAVDIVLSEDEKHICITCLGNDGLDIIVSPAGPVISPAISIHTNESQTRGAPCPCQAMHLFLVPTIRTIFAVDWQAHTSRAVYHAEGDEQVHSVTVIDQTVYTGASNREGAFISTFAILNECGNVTNPQRISLTDGFYTHTAGFTKPVPVLLASCSDKSITMVISEARISLVNAAVDENGCLSICQSKVVNGFLGTGITAKLSPDRVAFSWAAFQDFQLQFGVSVFDSKSLDTLLVQKTKTICTVKMRGSQSGSMMLVEAYGDPKLISID